MYRLLKRLVEALAGAACSAGTLQFSPGRIGHLLRLAPAAANRVYRVLFLPGLLLATTAVAAQTEPLRLSHAISATTIDAHIQYFNDRHGEYAIETIQDQAPHFTPLQEKGLVVSSRKHWYRLDLDSSQADDSHWYVSLGVSTASILNVWWQPQDATPQLLKPRSLDHFPSGREFLYPVYVVPLDIEQGGPGTIWVEYKGVASFPLKLRIYSEHDLFSSGLQFVLLNGFYLGAISIFLFIFAAQFVIRPSRVLGYYTLFVMSVILFMMQIGGYKSHFGLPAIWPYHNEVAGFIGGSIYLWYFLFTDQLFQLKQTNRTLHYVLLGLGGLVLAATLVEFFTDLDWLLSLVIALGLPLPLITAIFCARQNHPSARFFLVGSALHCMAAYLLILASFGMEVIYNKYLFSLASLGQLADIACFSMAILFQNDRLRSSFYDHVNQRVTDIHSLAESERLSSEALALSRNTLLKTAATAHDLQQPLSAARLLLSSGDAGNPAMQQARNALDYASTLLNSVLKSSRGDYEDIQRQTNMRLLLEQIGQRHRVRFDEAAVQLRMFCADRERVCMPLVINRILDNLLSNAIKYTQQGTVLLSGRARAGDRFLIQVWDTGAGMSPAQVRNILTPFRREATEELERFGYGLGLFIVKTLCDQAGYALSIRSREGRGTCVSILVNPPGA